MIYTSTYLLINEKKILYLIFGMSIRNHDLREKNIVEIQSMSEKNSCAFEPSNTIVSDYSKAQM